MVLQVLSQMSLKTLSHWLTDLGLPSWKVADWSVNDVVLYCTFVCLFDIIFEKLVFTYSQQQMFSMNGASSSQQLTFYTQKCKI